MADAYEYVTSTGVIVPDTADIKTDVENEYKDVFGADLVVTDNTPQGVLISAETTARDNVVRNNAALANQVNPNLAGGVYLDAIWALTGGQRIAATRSVVPAVTLAGVAGTTVPAGSLASTTDGLLFASAADVILPGSVDFIAQEYGPLAVNVAALTQIVSNVLGWESVTNATAATLGRNVETDGASRIRRRNTLALQGTALAEAIISGLYDTDGVTSLKFLENVEDSTQVIQGISLVAHSMWACVRGGTDADVAMALLRKKSLGCNFNGTTTVNVTDPSSGQLYVVKFERPAEVAIKVKATVRGNGVVPDVDAAVKQAILDFANGLLDSEPGLVVAASVSPFEFAGAVNRETPGIYVQKMEVATLAGSYQTTELAILSNQIATLSAANITVVQI